MIQTLPPKTKVIDGVTFSVGYLQLEEARAILLLLGKRIAPGLEGLADAMGDKVTLGDVEAAHAARALSRLLEGLEDTDLARMTEAMGKVSTVDVGDGKTPYLLGPQRELLFRGRLAMYFSWLAFAVEVNYSDFFARLLTLAGAVQGPAAAGK